MAGFAIPKIRGPALKSTRINHVRRTLASTIYKIVVPVKNYAGTQCEQAKQPSRGFPYVHFAVAFRARRQADGDLADAHLVYLQDK